MIWRIVVYRSDEREEEFRGKSETGIWTVRVPKGGLGTGEGCPRGEKD